MSKEFLKEKALMLTLRVLGYKQKDGQWAAHCLETDLVGYGKTFDKALAHLEELTQMQISFALYKDQPSLLDCSAPPEIFETFGILQRQALHYYPKKKTIDRKRKLASIQLPSQPDKADFSIVPA